MAKVLGRTIPDPIPGRVAVVGVCAAGKTTLVGRLREAGYDAVQCGQEHSHVPQMWQLLTRPEVLVYLSASLSVVRARRQPPLKCFLYEAQLGRLAHARSHADLVVDTDDLSRDKVAKVVMHALEHLGLTAS
jgi:hypothetical protein